MKRSIFNQSNSLIFSIKACSFVPVGQGYESKIFPDTNAIEKPLMARDFVDLINLRVLSHKQDLR